MHREFRHGGGSHEVVRNGEIYNKEGASNWASDYGSNNWLMTELRRDWHTSRTFFGTYRGTVIASGGSEVPEGYGDYEGDRGNAGLAYNGEWRDGVPRGTGWWQQINTQGVFQRKLIYAGEFDIHSPCGQGACWAWDARRSDGFRCFEGNWMGVAAPVFGALPSSVWRAQGIISI
jgi:hypothetical protein